MSSEQMTLIVLFKDVCIINSLGKIKQRLPVERLGDIPPAPGYSRVINLETFLLLPWRRFAYILG